MRRNCNLELRLLPSSDMEESQRRSSAPMADSSSSPQQSQPLTIFYNGKICVCDVSDFQAKAILLLANKEVGETVKTSGETVPSSPSVRSPVYTSTAALSMKRSLQRFLQKRAHRVRATSTPYHR